MASQEDKDTDFTTTFHMIISNGEFFQNIMSLFKYVEIITHPKNETVAHRLQVSFTCTSSLSSDVTYSWTHNGTSRSSTLSTLTITSVSYDDAGSYVCIVTSGSLSVMSNTATLTVYGMCIIT